MSAAVSFRALPEPHAVVLKEHPDKTVAYACPDCGALYTGCVFGGGEHGLIAARHAAQRHCHHYCTCGRSVAVGRTTCSDCWDLVLKHKEEKVFEKAEKMTIDEYPGDQPVFWDGPPKGSSIGDGYFLNVDDFLERCEEEEVEVPQYIWATTSVPLALSADFLIESAMNEHREDAREAIPSESELQLQHMLDTWCAAQKVKTWQPDYKRAILLHPKD